MTNEEAIDELEVIYERLSHPEDCEQGVYSFRDGDYLEALDMAIKALEQQPCDDCISRQEALSNKHIVYDDDGIGYSVVRADVIAKLPSVTPKAEQKAVLGKIRAEIEQLTSRYSISKERGGMGIVEWSDRLIEESDVLQIIDKYKAED